MKGERQVDLALGLLFNLGLLASILFVLSMTMIPALERHFPLRSDPPGREGREEDRGDPG